jgi:hypothetical protein
VQENQAFDFAKAGQEAALKKALNESPTVLGLGNKQKKTADNPNKYC